MTIIKKFIEDEIEKEINKQSSIERLQHSHPPLRFKVDGCKYCEKYGNIFNA